MICLQDSTKHALNISLLIGQGPMGNINSQAGTMYQDRTKTVQRCMSSNERCSHKASAKIELTGQSAVLIAKQAQCTKIELKLYKDVCQATRDAATKLQ